MAHRSNELVGGAMHLEREKLALNLATITVTSKSMVSKTDELIRLRAEIACRMAELHSLRAEINALAVKWGIEPIPTKGIQVQFEKPSGLLLAIPVEARE